MYIVPKGSDRSMNKQTYKGINKIMRYVWWKEKVEERVHEALMNKMLYGDAFYKK